MLDGYGEEGGGMTTKTRAVTSVKVSNRLHKVTSFDRANPWGVVILYEDGHVIITRFMTEEAANTYAAAAREGRAV